MSKEHFMNPEIQKIINYKVIIGLLLVAIGTYLEDLTTDPYHLFNIGSLIYCFVQLMRRSFVGKMRYVHISLEIVAITLMVLHSKTTTNEAVYALYLLVMMEIGVSFKGWGARIMLAMNLVSAVVGFGIQYWYSKNIEMLPFVLLFIVALLIVYSLGRHLCKYQQEKYSKEVLYNELLEVHRKLKSSSNQLEELTRAKEYERLFIGFHHKILDELTASIKRSEFVEQHIDKDTFRAKRMLNELVTSLKETLDVAERSAGAIKKDHLDVQCMVDTFAEKMGIIAYLHVEMNCAQLNHQLCQVIYKTLEEGLSNAARHSHTKHIWVNLVREGDLRIRLSIRDDGGIPEVVLPIVEGVGIKTMRERIESVGGHMFYAFHTEESDGFEIVAEFPIVMLEGLPT